MGGRKFFGKNIGNTFSFHFTMMRGRGMKRQILSFRIPPGHIAVRVPKKDKRAHMLPGMLQTRLGRCIRGWIKRREGGGG